ncbi:hypothetical protein JKA74_15670 [Marivirga sp. S37H4]|uniref:DUF4625 domain-containing protein n=1 Tax=Marivirga aurantiaca TaxID=2802615 RepID=A0A934X070_9BACT|nr:hypothetical protein [Marivirga aurantiaca]MBK6266483.1 hypothetical protein [Marivirga aurantiaca]
MRKLFRNAMMLSAMAGTLFFTACDGEGDEDLLNSPTVTVTTDPANGEVAVGEAISFTAEVDAPAGFNTLRIESIESADATITLSGYKTEYTRNDLGLDAGATSATVEFEPFSIPEAGEYTVELLAVDDDNQQTNQEFTITVTETGVVIYTDILVYAPAADGTTNTWFSTNLGETVTEGEVNAASAPNSSDVDFGYYYGAENMASIASPNAYPTLGGSIDISDWTTRNATEFKLTTVSDEEYVGIVSGTDLAEIWDRADNVNEGESITNLSVGDVVAFQLDTDNKGGLYGVFKVLSVEPGANVDDYIEIEVVVQEEEN